jgi:hypothetical protein
MTNMIKLAVAFLAGTVLVGCGGGSTTGNDDTPAFGRSDPKIEFFPQKPSLLSNRSDFPFDLSAPYFTQLNVKITDDNGFPSPGLTIVDLVISDGNVLNLGSPTSVRGCQGTASSVAPYFLFAGTQAGTAQITASVTAPLKSGTIDPVTGICKTEFQTGARDVTRQFNYTVNVGPAPFVRLAVSAGRTMLPVNTFTVAATATSPYLTPVEVTQRTAFGELVATGSVIASVARTDLAAVSTADDPSTPNVNELQNLRSSVTVSLVAGKALFYVHSLQRSGVATVNVSGRDGTSAVSQDLQVTIGGSPQGPAQVFISTDARPVYVANSNGPTVLPIQVRVLDDAGENIGDAAAGSNNLLTEIVNPSGETLTSVLASGGTNEGFSIKSRTSQGIVSATFRASSRQGIIQIRSTADRADNNVDNGIQTPVSATRALIVSDGKLFDLKITQPFDGLIGNTITFAGPLNSRRDGSYSTIMSVSATDRQGNPVLPNTAIEFGMIDAPTTGYPLNGGGEFEIGGLDGNPVEGGLNFTAPTGAFLTAGGGVGPNDTLITFGEQSGSIRDLEGARVVTRVNTQTSLDIRQSTRFNLNDDSTDGVPVDRGNVVPYAIGRATIGNVTNNALTNDKGLATTTLNYPVSRIGHSYIVWARGAGDTPRGQTTPELVSDVDFGRFPAALSLTISAAPSSITSGVTSIVQICVVDNFTNPVPSAFIRYGFDKASGTVDGASNGVVRTATDSGGCTLAAVRAFVASGGTTASDGKIIFSIVGGKAAAEVKIGAATGTALFAIPELLGGSGGRVTLRLLDGAGSPIPGIQISGKCAADAGIVDPPGATNAQGETTTNISANLDGIGSAKTSTCDFEALGAKATVKLSGVDLCKVGISPLPQGCPTPVVTPPAPRILTVNLLQPNGNVYVGATGGQVQVIGNAGGINCVSTATTTNGVCPSSAIPDGTIVSLVASTGISGVPDPNTVFCRWTGDVGCFGTQPSVQVNLTGSSKTCSAVFSPVGPAGCPNQ